MRVLVACEESQTVTKAFRARGHNAFSCDLLPASGGIPSGTYGRTCATCLRARCPGTC